jgi:DNA polymerase
MSQPPDDPAAPAATPLEELGGIVADLRAWTTWAGDAGLHSLPVSKAAAAAAPAFAAPGAPATAAPSSGASPWPTRPPLPRAVAAPPPPPAQRPQAVQPGLIPGLAPKPAPVPAPARVAPAAGGKVSLPTLESVLGEIGENCTRCKLGKGRTKLVYGTGSATARLVFVGEAPGEDEDLSGIPFVGKAGQLLTKMIEAMGLSRDTVYICNTVKCRPPNNRNPEADELSSCEPFLVGQLAAIKPEVIVTLGKFAAQALLRDQTPISRLRGSWREYQGIPTMPTFHPAYLLRSPDEKGKVWSDLQQVMKKLGLPAKP